MVSPTTVTLFFNMTPGFKTTLGPTKQKGPIFTLDPTFAPSSTIAVR